MMLLPETKTPKAFRRAILSLAQENVLENGSADVTRSLLSAYMYACEAEDVFPKTVSNAEDVLRTKYVEARLRLDPSETAETFLGRFETNAMPGEDFEVPVTFLNEVAEMMARKEHAEDEALFRAACSNFAARG